MVEDQIESAANIKTFMKEAIKAIDLEFGDGFAQQNPALLGNYLTALTIERGSRHIADEVANLRPSFD